MSTPSRSRVIRLMEPLSFFRTAEIPRCFCLINAADPVHHRLSDLPGLSSLVSFLVQR
jgi:hypothetical protein